ncbi:MAG: hypothetical protein ACREB9_00685, partial [Thermoplasmata archaeon]
MATPIGEQQWNDLLALKGVSTTVGVSSLNTVAGAITISGGTGITVAVSGQTITITASGAGVSSVNSLTGALTVAAGTGISVAASGTTVTITATTGGVTSVNALAGALTVAAGSGISVSASGSTITITATGAATALQGPPSAEVIAYNSAGTITVTDNANFTTPGSFSTADAALAAAITALGSKSGTILFGTGTWTFASQHVIPVNTSVRFESGSTVVGTLTTGTLYGQFTVYPIFVMGNNSSFVGANETSNSGALVVVPSTVTTCRVSECTIVSQLQIVVLGQAGDLLGPFVMVVDNTFTGSGNVALSGSAAVTCTGEIMIVRNRFIQITGTIFDMIGTNLSANFFVGTLTFSQNMVWTNVWGSAQTLL